MGNVVMGQRLRGNVVDPYMNVDAGTMAPTEYALCRDIV
jgi:CTP synthase (UTP-ammonia lyase)